MKISPIEKMQLVQKFGFIGRHPWRAPYHVLIESNQPGAIDDYGVVMIEQLEGKYHVCRVERFLTPAHMDIFTGHQVNESAQYQPKYYKSFSHSQLDQAFKHAIEINKTDLVTNTIEV